MRWAGGAAADGFEGCCGESILLDPGAVYPIVHYRAGGVKLCGLDVLVLVWLVIDRIA